MKKSISTLFVLLSFLVSAQDKKISQLPALPSVAGNEQIPLAISGTNYYVTPSQLKTWFNGTYMPLADTNKFIPLTGTTAAHSVLGTIEALVGGKTVLSCKDANGFSIGYGDDADSLFGSSKIYAITLWDSLQTYLQYYNNLTHYGAEFNLASNDGSGGNGTFARIAAIDYGAGHGTSTNWLLDGILVAGNGTSFKGMMYDQDYSSHFTKYTLVDSNWVATHYAPSIGGAYVPATGSITINGTTQTYTSNPTFTISTGNIYTVTSPLTISSGTVIGIGQATTSTNGYLSSTDWNTFNNKGSGSVTSFLYTNGNGFTGTVNNASTTPTLSLSLQNATTSQNGQLTSTDWNTFNGKQSALSGTGFLCFSGTTPSYTTSIPNTSLANSTFTVNGTAMALGTSSTVTSAAGTLTGTGLNSTVVTSSLTTVGIVTGGVWNSKIIPVVGAVTTASVITINTDNYNMYTVTSLSTATTFTVPTGTPSAGQSLIIRIKDNGTARALTFSTATNGFRFSTDAPAPTTTTLSKTMYLGFRWNEASNTWDNVSPYIDNF